MRPSDAVKFVNRAILRAGYITTPAGMLEALGSLAGRIELPEGMQDTAPPKQGPFRHPMVMRISRQDAIPGHTYPQLLQVSFDTLVSPSALLRTAILMRSVHRLFGKPAFVYVNGGIHKSTTTLGTGNHYYPPRKGTLLLVGVDYAHPLFGIVTDAPLAAYQDIYPLLYCLTPGAPLRNPEQWGLARPLEYPLQKTPKSALGSPGQPSTDHADG